MPHPSMPTSPASPRNLIPNVVRVASPMLSANTAPPVASNSPIKGMHQLRRSGVNRSLTERYTLTYWVKHQYGSGMTYRVAFVSRFKS